MSDRFAVQIWIVDQLCCTAFIVPVRTYAALVATAQAANRLLAAAKRLLGRYLDFKRELVTLDKQPSGRWFAVLTRHGVDVAEYTVDCEPGIARPAKYW